MFWRKFPKKKPKLNGWYQCTIEYVDNDSVNHYVMDLYWYGAYHRGKGAFIDNRRNSIFENYYVYAKNPVARPDYYHQIHPWDESIRKLIDRTEQVVAWKKTSRPFITKRYVECNTVHSSTNHGWKLRQKYRL